MKTAGYIWSNMAALAIMISRTQGENFRNDLSYFDIDLSQLEKD
jgi:hypothetical protein